MKKKNVKIKLNEFIYNVKYWADFSKLIAGQIDTITFNTVKEKKEVEKSEKDEKTEEETNETEENKKETEEMYENDCECNYTDDVFINYIIYALLFLIFLKIIFKK